MNDKAYKASFRHARYYCEVLLRLDALYQQGGGAVSQALTGLDQELANIRVGQAWSRAHAHLDEEVTHLCSRYPRDGDNLLALRLLPQERVAWLEDALDAARALHDHTSEAALLSSLGMAFKDKGELRRALAYQEQSLHVARGTEAALIKERTLGNLGGVYQALGDYQQAIACYDQQLPMARELQDQRGEANALMNMGIAHAFLGNLQRAIA